MNNVKVTREELLAKVRANHDAHRNLFLKAQRRLRKLVVEELARMLADAKEGRPFQRSVTMTEPSNHIKDYDRVITMLEMSVDQTIVLDASEFDHYVMDPWDWSRFAYWTNTAYAGETPCAPGPFRS